MDLKNSLKKPEGVDLKSSLKNSPKKLVWEISEEGMDVKSSPKKPAWKISEEGMDVKSSLDVLVIVGCCDQKVREEPVNFHLRN